MEENKHKWKLVRERDGLTKYSEDIRWFSQDEDGYFKDKHNTIEVGRHLLMSPFSLNFTWATTVVKKIVEHKEDYIKFQTKNSTYELFKLKKD